MQRLLHGFLRAYALQPGVGADTSRDRLDLRYASVAEFSHDVGRTVLQHQSLALLVPAHRNDPRVAHLPGGQRAHQTS